MLFLRGAVDEVRGEAAEAEEVDARDPDQRPAELPFLRLVVRDARADPDADEPVDKTKIINS